MSEPTLNPDAAQEPKRRKSRTSKVHLAEDLHSAPESVPVPPAAEEPAKTTRRKKKPKAEISEPQVRQILTYVADFNCVLKPAVLQPIWKVSEQEIQNVSEPLAECLQRLPDRYLKSAEKLLDLSAPLAVIAGCYAIAAPRMAQEKEIRQAYANAQVNQAGPGAAPGAGPGIHVHTNGSSAGPAPDAEPHIYAPAGLHVSDTDFE